MKLSARLLEIANSIKPGSNVADIGADHGLLTKFIIKNNIAKKVFAVENKNGPYKALTQCVKDMENVETSLSDGISKLPADIDTVVIAGMGGHLIADILEKDSQNLKNVKTIIVDAHRDLEYLRRTVVSLGYKMTSENLVKDGLFYHIIIFEKGFENHTPLEYEFGYNISKSSLFNEYLEDRISHLQKNYQKNHDPKILDTIERMKQL